MGGTCLVHGRHGKPPVVLLLHDVQDRNQSGLLIVGRVVGDDFLGLRSKQGIDLTQFGSTSKMTAKHAWLFHMTFYADPKERDACCKQISQHLEEEIAAWLAEKELTLARVTSLNSNGVSRLLAGLSRCCSTQRHGKRKKGALIWKSGWLAAPILAGALGARTGPN